MWIRYTAPIVAVSFSLVASLASYEVSFAQRSRDYTPSEFRSVLRGFGYNVMPGDSLTDPATREAIREFQEGYNIQVDGIVGPQTQNLAAELVRILRANLNLVLEPSPALPSTQFYDEQTEAAVRRFQEQFNLPVTGIATLQVRQRLDQEAKRILGQPSPTTSPSPSPSPSPTTSPSPSPSPSPTTSPSPSPSPSPTISPSPSPTMSPSPSPTISPSPSPTMSPSPSPTISPSPSPSPIMSPSPSPTMSPSPSPTINPSPSPTESP